MHRNIMKSGQIIDMDDEDMRACRMALRSSVAAVISRLIREKGMNQIEVSGAAGLSRNTIQNVLGAGHHDGAPCPKLDTIADILYALRVTPEDFAIRLAEELRYCRAAAGCESEGHTFEISLGGHILRGELVCTQESKKAK